MPVSPGDRIGPYTFSEKIGEGGMGEVYRATDNNLKRDVAIKLLPEAFTQNPERLARFQREAEVLAQLHHPNIASIFGIEESDGVRALVMELVEGPTLGERLSQGRLSVDEALEIARQIAIALEEAHAKSIVHRDLKPANVKLTPERRVKVLDFGLAKALDPTTDLSGAGPNTLAHSPTLTASTQLGVILGTAAYMSPEQARGEPVDKRADVWAFGCVLFEMLTGRTTFRENTVSDTLASVLKIEPKWDHLPADTPHNLRRLLTRCLRKDAQQRLHDIADARIEIEETLATPADKRVVAPIAGSGSRMSRVSTALLVTAGLAIGLFAGLRWGSAEPERTVRRFFLPVKAENPRETLSNPVLSPDGRKIVYDLNQEMWLHDLQQGTTLSITGAEGGDMPFWAPDGEQIGFRKAESLWRIPVGGGQPSLIVDEAPTYQPPSWGDDGMVVFHTLETIHEIPARGGELKTILQFDPELEQHFHEVYHLPGGRGLLFVRHPDERADTISLLAGGQRRDLLTVDRGAIFTPTYAPTGHLLFTRGEGVEGLWAVEFSLAKLEVTGNPFLVVPNGMNGSAGPDGTLIYVDRVASRDVELVWFDTDGTILGTVGEPQTDMYSPAISPDGKKVAVSAAEGEEWDIWVHDDTGGKVRLTFDQGKEAMPRWSRDGNRVFFHHPDLDQVLLADSGASIYSVDSETGGQRELLISGSQSSYGPDDSSIVFQRAGTTSGAPHRVPASLKGNQTQGDIWSWSIDGNSDPELILGTDADEEFPSLSPDGRYMAYCSDETGTGQLHVRPFPTGTESWQVSTRHGWLSHWGPSGDRLYYHDFDWLMVVRVSTDPVLQLGTPRTLLDSGAGLHLWRGTDLAKDGKRFVGIREVERNEVEAVESGIRVVLNWLSDFKD